MTAEEAIKCLDLISVLDSPGLKKALEMAKQALEKQIPKKPDIYGDGYDNNGNLIYDTYDCPNCHTSYEIECEKYDYCPCCGQALNWSEENEKT